MGKPKSPKLATGEVAEQLTAVATREVAELGTKLPEVGGTQTVTWLES